MTEVKPWQERCPKKGYYDPAKYMQAEITELRAALEKKHD